MIDKLHETINKGNHAKRILDDEGINQVLSALGADWTKQAIACAIPQPDKAVTFLLRVNVLEELRSALQIMVSNAREAARELEKMQPPKPQR